MYTPPHFKETNPERLEALIRDYAFGMLVSVHDGLPFVSHIPFLFERRDSGSAVLLGHIAKANPQWRDMASGQTMLAVFNGPHAYISPGWYGSPGVPTWDYAVVHVYGQARTVEAEAETEKILERLTAVYEANQPKPWKFSFGPEWRAKLLGMVTGFEMQIQRVEGKFKLDQHRSAEDQRAVAERLTESGEPLSIAVAKLMQFGSSSSNKKWSRRVEIL